MYLSVSRNKLLLAAALLAGLAFNHQVAAQAVPPLKVALHFNVPQLSWYGVYFAQDKGYYKEAGIELDLQYLRGSALAVQAVASGQSSVGIAGADTVLSGIQQNVSITAIANHIQTDPGGVIVRDDGKVNSMKDLAGKTLATSVAIPLAGLMKAALKREGVLDAVKIQYVDLAATCTLMIAGQIDGCTGYNYFQLFQVEDKGVKAKFFPFSTQQNPILGWVIFVNNVFLAQNEEMIKKFLAVTARGYVEANADPKATLALMTRIADTIPADQQARVLPVVMALTTSERQKQNGWGYMNDQVWRDLYQGLQEGDLLKPGIDISKVYTNKYLPQGYGR